MDAVGQQKSGKKIFVVVGITKNKGCLFYDNLCFFIITYPHLE
jgi:hypothetical protein